MIVFKTEPHMRRCIRIYIRQRKLHYNVNETTLSLYAHCQAEDILSFYRFEVNVERIEGNISKDIKLKGKQMRGGPVRSGDTSQIRFFLNFFSVVRLSFSKCRSCCEDHNVFFI